MKLYSKNDYQKLLLELLDPLKSYFSPGNARVRLPGAGSCYSRDIVEMEAFARPLWGLVPFWAGGGSAPDWERRYRKGLVEGTDPAGPEYWGICGDCDQRFVEMAPIALGLMMAPHILWDPLSAVEKERLAQWLFQINLHELPPCNWYYFRVLVNLALRLLGMDWDERCMKKDLEEMEAWYLEDGWYQDGASLQKDYYSAFAMEFYSQIYAYFCEEEDKKEELLSRARQFGREFIYWFDEEGNALSFGRSLTYRFAQTAYWSAAVYTGICEEGLDTAKGIIGRNIRTWLSREIFRPDGVLSVGYGYENLTMAEKYNGPGSPYWALKTFLVLALPDEHPFWQVEEAPLPKLKYLHPSISSDMLIQHSGRETCAYVSAVYSPNVLGHYVEKYAKFVYSSRFSFSVSHSTENLAEAACDNMLAFVLEHDERVWVRRRSLSFSVEQDKVLSVWSPVEGIRVSTEIRPVTGGHVRHHEIESDRICKAYDCGFSVEALAESSWSRIGNAEAEAGSRHGSCKVTKGMERGTPCLIQANPNTHLLYKNTVIPAVCYEILPGKTILETWIESRG